MKDEMKHQAKMEVLQELMNMAQDMMGAKFKGDMDGMQKVSVMAPDSEHLSEGLDKAKDLVESTDAHMDEDSGGQNEPDKEKSAEDHEAMAQHGVEKMSSDEKDAMMNPEDDEKPKKKKKLFDMYADDGE